MGFCPRAWQPWGGAQGQGVAHGWPTGETRNPGREQMSARWGHSELDGFRLGRTELEVLSEHPGRAVWQVAGGVSVQLLVQQIEFQLLFTN